MGDRSSGDNEFWENLVIFVVLGALAVLGYRKVKPMVEGWLNQHGTAMNDVLHRIGSVDRVLDVAAVILGLVIVICLVQAWRKMRGRRRRRVW